MRTSWRCSDKKMLDNWSELSRSIEPHDAVWESCEHIIPCRWEFDGLHEPDRKVVCEVLHDASGDPVPKTT